MLMSVLTPLLVEKHLKTQNTHPGPPRYHEQYLIATPALKEKFSRFFKSENFPFQIYTAGETARRGVGGWGLPTL